MKNLDYRAWGTTLKLVLGVWATFLILFVLGKVSEATLVSITTGGVFAWVLRDGIAKAAEAYRDSP